jgi:3-deoxy-D-manno-octulosonate 8-phosphate phosphatase (KDO 8-P phosphatase)
MNLNKKPIRLVAIDVDGTLTDGMYIVSTDGSVSKGFNTHDFWAIQRLQEAGIAVAIVTHCNDTCINEKIDTLPESSRPMLTLAKLSWQTSKEDYIENFLRKDFHPTVEWDEIAYIGDAENDFDAMKKCGITGCPSDAVSIIKEESNFIANSAGGRGAVYEFVNHLIEAQEHGNKHYRTHDKSETEVITENAKKDESS